VCIDFTVLKQVHEEILRSGFHSNAFIGNSLIDMYVNCGQVKDVRDMFEKLPQINIVSWNEMFA
jgi:pentatricopeptide repeat protein